jgi:hypothetical protein
MTNKKKEIGNPQAIFWEEYDKEVDKLKTKFEKSQLIVVNKIVLERTIIKWKK